MSMIKPSFVESSFHAFFQLDPSRPFYYNLVFRAGRDIFIQLGAEEKADELHGLIELKLEKPLNAKLHAILKTFYNQRFLFSQLAYIKVGEGIDAIYITRYEIETIMEEIKDWVYDEVIKMTPFIRFTQRPEILG